MTRIMLFMLAIVLILGVACNPPALKGEEKESEPDQVEPIEVTEEDRPTDALENISPEEPTPIKLTEEEPTQLKPTQEKAAFTPLPVDLSLNPNPPDQLVKLIFIHHSSGENWLGDEHGGLGLALMANNYFVSDTNYGWGPNKIGDTTDIGHWWTWFAGPRREKYMKALFQESGQNAGYSRLEKDPGGENVIVMFKSCFPNSALERDPDEPPTSGDNPLRGQDAGSGNLTIANAKGIYVDLLTYFETRPDKLFIVITAPPLGTFDTNPDQAANARAFNRWLVEEWLKNYPLKNVAVFDFYNVLTSNGGNLEKNDAGESTGNHHRFWGDGFQYVTDQGMDFSAYAANGDSHPTAAGNQKATAEYLPLLNIFYHRWLTSQ